MNWDPLTWWLRIQQWRLRRHGFRRLKMRLGNTTFGYYVREGAANATPLMLVHGLALYPEWWSPLLKQLSPDRYSLCVPELIGFGRSPGKGLAPAAFNLALFRDQFRNLMKSLDWDRMILAGLSMGGWACLDYALARPDDLSGLILIAPAGANLDATEEDLQNLRKVFDYQTPEEFSHLINEYVLSRPRPIPRWVGSLAVWRSRANGHKHLLQNLAYKDWVGRRVESIATPTAAIWGRQDKTFPISAGEDMERAMPRAKLIPMENTAHSYMTERPKETCQAFFDALDFVEKNRDKK
jgi:pimeloyl-ACP methyl ester carboxylesterase